MSSRRSPSLLSVALSLLLLSHVTPPVTALEPVTTTLAVGVAAITSIFFAGYDTFKCQFSECCGEPWFQPNISGLSRALSSRLHGQHVVAEAVIPSVAGHVKYPNPEKALVLSFHGPTGSGKNFVSRLLAENLYRRGVHSRYVHLFHAPSDFPHDEMLPVYQDQLRAWIRGNVSSCGRHLFIFDEVDKMPAGLINAIKPFLDHYPQIQGVDYRRNIFILLSNSGGREINDYVLAQWRAGRKREDIKYSELEQILTRSAFNDKGGLWHSSLIDHNLVSAFIPFLPLERAHVSACIRDDLVAKGLGVTAELVERVAAELTYSPADLKLYSTTGCKRVSEKVNFHAVYSEM